jgi:ABC-type uncharacterized transport system auxiliary subunit
MFSCKISIRSIFLFYQTNFSSAPFTSLFQKISHLQYNLLFRLILELNEFELDEDGEDKALVSASTKLQRDLLLV